MNENDLLDELLNDFATIPAVGEKEEEQPKEEKEEAAQADFPAFDEPEETVAQPSAESAEEQPTQPEQAEGSPVEQPADEPAEEFVNEPEIVVSHMDAPTQVVSLEQLAADQEQEDEGEDPFEGQMTLADFVEEEQETSKEEEALLEDEISWEEQLEQTRREKIRDFQIQKNREDTDFRIGDDEAPDELPVKEELPTEEAPPPAKVKFTGDFTEQEQAADVAAELSHRLGSMKFRLWLAAAAQILLVWAEGGVLLNGVPAVAPSLFLWVNIIGLTAIMALLFPMLRDGAVALFRLKPSAESIPTVVGVTVWLHTLLQWFRLSEIEAGTAPLLAAAGGLLVLLCGIGRLLRVSRIARNFSMVGVAGEKVAAALVQDERTAVEIGRRAVATGVPRVAYFRSADFLHDFLANSYMNDRYDAVLKRYIPCALAVSLVAAVIYGVAVTGFFEAVTLFCMLLCVLLPAASLALNLPLWRECNEQLENGNMLCSFAAAERFGDIHGVALDVSDVYLSDSVMLHGIRTFGATRIDEAIMDAAAVAIRTEGPLAGLFMRIIEGKTEILQAVDNLVFEQDMGFSGWVGGRRVLVGNRKLLENHGVDTPSGDYERKYKKDGRELVYLSVAGELSAMFIISYVTDDAVKAALHALQESDVSLLIRSCDPNVTEESLCAGFELDDFYLDLLTASAGRLYDNLRHNEEARVSAGAVTNGTVIGIARLLTGCKRLRRRGITAMLVQIGLAALGAVGLAAGVLSAPLVLLWVAASALLSMLVPLF